MRKGAPVFAVLAVAAATIMAGTGSASASGSGAATGARGDPPPIGQRWLSRLDPGLLIPDDLALRFAGAAMAAGMTRGQAASMLNDERFAAAVGSPDQGYGLLLALIENPDHIRTARELLEDDGAGYTLSGATSFQTGLFRALPDLRNAYLEDLGHMIAVRPDGVEVLVDIETGRQIIGQGKLGMPVAAPGGGPLPKPEISPEEAAAAMWAQAGVDPLQTSGQVPPGPGLDFSTDEPHRGLMTPGIYLVAALFALAWAGFAVKMIVRRAQRP